MTEKHQSLRNIAKIISGYTFRKAVEPKDEGHFLVLQAKDIDDDLIISDKELAKVSRETIRTNSFIRNNDVIISSRGSFKSAVVKSSKKILAIMCIKNKKNGKLT